MFSSNRSSLLGWMVDWCRRRRCGEMRKKEGGCWVGEEFGVGGGEEPIGSCGATAHLLWLPLLHPSIYRHSHWNTSLPHKSCPHSEGQFRQQLPSLGVQSNCHEKHLICESLRICDGNNDDGRDPASLLFRPRRLTKSYALVISGYF